MSKKQPTPRKVRKKISEFRAMTKEASYLDAIDAALENDGLAVISMCIYRAKQGDATCLKICTDYLFSKLKSVSLDNIAINAADVKTVAGIAEANAHILQSMSSGKLDINHGKIFSSVLQAQQSILDNGELEKRLEALESALRKDIDGC